MARHPRRTSALRHDPAASSRPAGVAGGAHAIQPAEAVDTASAAAQPSQPDAGPKRATAKMTGRTNRYALVAKSLQMEEELATLRQSMIQMSARMLRLELALSVLDTDGSLTAILRPEQFQPERF